MQLVTRGVQTAMDTDSPDDLNPEDNGKIEEFAHAYLTSGGAGFKMFVQTTFANGKIENSRIRLVSLGLGPSRQIQRASRQKKSLTTLAVYPETNALKIRKRLMLRLATLSP